MQTGRRGRDRSVICRTTCPSNRFGVCDIQLSSLHRQLYLLSHLVPRIEQPLCYTTNHMNVGNLSSKALFLPHFNQTSKRLAVSCGRTGAFCIFGKTLKYHKSASVWLSTSELPVSQTEQPGMTQWYSTRTPGGMQRHVRGT